LPAISFITYDFSNPIFIYIPMKISRKSALTSLVSSLLSLPFLSWGRPQKESANFKVEFAAAWKRSRDYTLKIFNQMPEEHLDFHYTEEAMTFRSQFVHCVSFTAAQLSDRFEAGNPFNNDINYNTLSKAQIAAEIGRFYDWVGELATKQTSAKLNEMRGFSGEKMPNWQFFYAMENHLIHHRGQAICYLRLKGVTPEGYVGW
jgi:uncharacterized damage-inducible protein DinB